MTQTHTAIEVAQFVRDRRYFDTTDARLKNRFGWGAVQSALRLGYIAKKGWGVGGSDLVELTAHGEAALRSEPGRRRHA